MKKNILLFSSVEWNWMKQRPHFLAIEMAEQGHSVVYLAINPQKKRDEQLLNDLRLCEISKVRGYMRTGVMRFVARCKIAFRLRKCSVDVVILTNPVQLQMLPRRIRKQAVLIYDCMDLIPAFYTGRRRALVENMERILCCSAEGITVSSSALRQHITERYHVPLEKTALICNALSPRDCLEAAHSPQVQNMKHPAMIYMGSVDRWLDLQTLERFMASQSKWHLYIAGNVNPEIAKRLKMIPNCVLLGQLEHLEALRHVNSADVALLPFVTGGLVDMVDPVKLYEYLALNKPVVSTYWPALDHFRTLGRILFYRDQSDFAQQLEAAQRTAATNNREVQAFIQENDWKKRAKDMVEFIVRKSG